MKDTHRKKYDFLFAKSTGAKLKAWSVVYFLRGILFSKNTAKEIIFLLISIMVLLCNMIFLKSRIPIIESMYYEP